MFLRKSAPFALAIIRRSLRATSSDRGPDIRPPPTDDLTTSSLKKNLPLGDGVTLPLATELVLALYMVSLVLATIPQHIHCDARSKARSYLSVVGNVGQDTRDETHVDEGHPSVAGGPAEVLVAVGIEFYRSMSVCVLELHFHNFGH